MAIGELLGEPDAYYIEILDTFVEALSFTKMDLVEALRLFLSKFRLPVSLYHISYMLLRFG